MLRELNWIRDLQVTMATPSGHHGNLELCSRAVRKQYPKSLESGHGFPSLQQPVALMWKLKAGSFGVCAHTQQTGRRPSQLLHLTSASPIFLLLFGKDGFGPSAISF